MQYIKNNTNTIISITTYIISNIINKMQITVRKEVYIMANNKPNRLKDLVVAQEQQEAEEKAQREVKKLEIDKSKKDTTVSRIVTDTNSKSKQISAKVNETIYESFTKINRLQGVSNNSAINMIIAKYVRENKDILDEE